MTTSAPPASPAASLAAGATNAVDGLRDIVGPVPIVSPLERLLLWGSLAVALALAALALAWWWRRRRVLPVGPPPPPPLPPHERARRRLEDALRLIPDPDRFCTEVSGILRTYLEERFGWNAPDRTTEEFLGDLRQRGELAASQKELLQDFLTRCDFVKFARYEPAEVELRDLHRAAARLVEDTVPRPAPPPGTGGPAPEPAAATRPSR